MLKNLSITACNVKSQDGKNLYPISVEFEGRELTIWRTEKQFKTDISRSGLGEDITKLNFSHLVGGQLKGDITFVEQGDKYTVETIDEKTKKVTTEERERKADGLQVEHGFLSISLNLNQSIASTVAQKMLENMGI